MMRAERAANSLTSLSETTEGYPKSLSTIVSCNSS